MIDMRAQVIHQPQEMSYDHVRTPELGGTDILIRIGATLTCGTDLKAYLRGHPILSFPVTVGHEYAGEVVSVGSQVQGFSEGDRVVTVHSGPCLACFYCLRGQENLCQSLTETMVWGGFAQYVRIPSHVHRSNTIKLPPGLSFDHAAFLEPVACVVYGMKHVDLTGVENAVVLGAGPIALLFIQRLKSAGVPRVICAGKHANRLAKAEEVGADHVFDVEALNVHNEVRALTGGYGTDLVVECVGQIHAWDHALSLTRKGGQVLLFGGCPSGTKVTLDTRRIHYDELTLKGVFHYTPREVREAFDLIQTGQIKVDPLITGEFELSALPHAFDRLIQGNGIKYVIRPDNG